MKTMNENTAKQEENYKYGDKYMTLDEEVENDKVILYCLENELLPY